MHSGRVRIEILGKVPPSLNVVAGRPSAAGYRRFKALWGSLFEAELLAAQARGDLPRIQPSANFKEPPAGQLEFVEAAAAVRFNVHRERDEGNFRATIEKALVDALVGDRKVWPHGRWLPDDRAGYFAFRELAMYVDTKKPVVTVVHFDWRKATLL